MDRKGGGKPTLFSYFKPTQTPPAKKKPPPRNALREQGNEGPSSVRVDAKTTPTRMKTLQSLEDDDSEDEIGKPKTLSGRAKRKASLSVEERNKIKKRKRSKVLDSDDEDEAYEPNESTLMEEEEEEEEENLDMITPVKKKTQSAFKTPGSTPRSRTATPRNILATPTNNGGLPATPSSTVSTPSGCGLEKIGTFLHDSLEFIKDEKRRDKNGVKFGDPDHNTRTLMVPSSFLNKLTPAMRQWWTIKSENYDTILFFKVGKFYELYHMDAVVGVKELKLIFMKGDFAHAGFPEKAFGRYSQTLIQKGYRIARVEQTETPQMMEERVQKMTSVPTRFDKVVRRELCSLITKGTRTLGFFEGEEPESESAYLLAVKENTGSCSQNEIEFGVCFLDTCIGTFHLGQFKDDRHLSRLRTLLAHYPPVQIVMERGNLSYKTQQLVNQVLSTAMKDSLSSGSEFWGASKTLKYLTEQNFLQENSAHAELQKMISDEDSLGLSPAVGYDLALSSLGACVWTLKRSLIDHDLLQLGQFQEFVPVDESMLYDESMVSSQEGVSPDSASFNVSIATSTQLTNQKMILDGITLCNLDVIDNHGVGEGTLLCRLDHTSTPFGRRLLKEWVAAPLCSPAGIRERQDAVAELVEKSYLLSEVKEILKSLPDLERLLRRIHVLGSKVRGEAHPDSRAILYESLTYNKKKIKDFLSLLDGLDKATQLIELFSSHTITSKLLLNLVTLESDQGQFPNLHEQLEYFNGAFDQKTAKEKGAIIPRPGVSPEYDQSLEDIKQVEQDLQEYLLQQRKRLKCKSITFFGTGRNRFQLEVPSTIQVPEDYEIKSQRKGFFRYLTRETEDFLNCMTEAEERKDSALRDTMRTLFHSFGEHFNLWDSAIRCVSILDVLVSMATYSSGEEGMCRPQVTASEFPYLEIKNGRHPCVIQTFTGGDFIPNDVIINSDRVGGGKMCTLVTGPNMGGKSTLMRQTGLIVILAQMGCFVPASSCSLSPVDRIFTRLGASDRIMHGESTFFVEVSETSVILYHSTINSLILLDELGRGTATYDGTAIATAVVKYIAEKKQCRTLFSTHYHSLVDEFKDNPHVQLGHMSCMVGDEEDSITFLYKFVEGACPKSYGFNAAKLAGLPQEVIEVAKETAHKFEKTSLKGQLFRKILSADTITPSALRAKYKTMLKDLL